MVEIIITQGHVIIIRNSIPIIVCQPITKSSKQLIDMNSKTGNSAVQIHLGAISILWTSFDTRSIMLPVVVSRRRC